MPARLTQPGSASLDAMQASATTPLCIFPIALACTARPLPAAALARNPLPADLSALPRLLDCPSKMSA
eukprot:15560914-Heterocapsa_arctica.AAC.1